MNEITKYLEYVSTDETMKHTFDRIYRETLEESGGEGVDLFVFRDRLERRFYPGVIRIVNPERLEEMSKLDHDRLSGYSFYPIVNGKLLLSGCIKY